MRVWTGRYEEGDDSQNRFSLLLRPGIAAVSASSFFPFDAVRPSGQWWSVLHTRAPPHAAHPSIHYPHVLPVRNDSGAQRDSYADGLTVMRLRMRQAQVSWWGLWAGRGPTGELRSLHKADGDGLHDVDRLRVQHGRPPQSVHKSLCQKHSPSGALSDGKPDAAIRCTVSCHIHTIALCCPVAAAAVCMQVRTLREATYIMAASRKTASRRHLNRRPAALKRGLTDTMSGLRLQLPLSPPCLPPRQLPEALRKMGRACRRRPLVDHRGSDARDANAPPLAHSCARCLSKHSKSNEVDARDGRNTRRIVSAADGPWH